MAIRISDNVRIWDGRAQLHLSHPLLMKLPIPRGKVVCQEAGNRLTIALEGKHGTWVISHNKEGVVLNAEGEAYRENGLTPVDLRNYSRARPAHLYCWQIILGYDFRGLAGRAEVPAAQFAREAAHWLKQPSGIFPYTLKLVPSSYGSFLLPVGEKQLLFGRSRFESTFHAGRPVAATLDHRPGFGRIELSVYDAQTQLPFAKWFLSEETGLVYSVRKDGLAGFLVDVPPGQSELLLGRTFVTSGIFRRRTSQFYTYFLDNQLVEIRNTSNAPLEMTVGEPLQEKALIPVVVGRAIPGQPHPALTGFFPVRVAWQTKQHRTSVYFCGLPYYFSRADITQLGLKNSKLNLIARVERGLVTAFISNKGTAREQVVKLGLKRDALWRMQSVVRRGREMITQEVEVAIFEGIRTRISGGRYRWQVILNGKAIKIPHAPQQGQAPEKVCLVVRGLNEIIFWRPGNRFAPTTVEKINSLLRAERNILRRTEAAKRQEKKKAAPKAPKTRLSPEEKARRRKLKSIFDNWGILIRHVEEQRQSRRVLDKVTVAALTRYRDRARALRRQTTDPGVRQKLLAIQLTADRALSAQPTQAQAFEPRRPTPRENDSADSKWEEGGTGWCIDREFDAE